MRPTGSQAIKADTSWLRLVEASYAVLRHSRRGKVLGLQSGGRQFTGRWKNKCHVNKCLPCPCRDNGTQSGL